MGHLPDHYVMKRWTKGANENVKRSASERSMDPGNSSELKMLRFSATKSDLMEIGKIGALSPEAFRCLKELIPGVKEKLLAIVQKVGADEELMDQIHGVKIGVPNIASDKEKIGTNLMDFTVPVYLDPPQAQCKGRKKNPTRFVPASCKKTKKMRTCSRCNKKAGHNSRTCQESQEGSGKGKQKACDSEDYNEVDDEVDDGESE